MRECKCVNVFVCLCASALVYFVSAQHLCATIMPVNPVLYTVCVLSSLSVMSVLSHVLL